MGMIIWYIKNNFNATESSFKIGTEKKVKDLQKILLHRLYAIDVIVIQMTLPMSLP